MVLPEASNTQSQADAAYTFQNRPTYIGKKSLPGKMINFLEKKVFLAFFYHLVSSIAIVDDSVPSAVFGCRSV